MAVFPSKNAKGYVAMVNFKDHAGKSRQARRNARTQNEAKGLEADLLGQRKRLELPGQKPPAPATPERPTTGAFLLEWLANRDNLRASTAKRYGELLAHVIRTVGETPLDELTPEKIDGLYRRLREDGLADKTRLNVHRVLKLALRLAASRRYRYMDHNPADDVDAPRAGKFDHYRLTRAELNQILVNADDTPWFGSIIRLLAWTGLRLGEGLALKWTDLDLDAARLTVRRMISTKNAIGEPKTRRSRRTISLSPDTVKLLRDVLARQLGDKMNAPPGMRGQSLYVDDGWVFALPLGKHRSQSHVNNVWRSVVTKVDVPRARIHDLRHAHAAHLLANGWDVAVVAERLGHEQISTTLDTYAYAIPGRGAELAADVDRIFGAGS